jgi:hypothetical protein
MTLVGKFLDIYTRSAQLSLGFGKYMHGSTVQINDTFLHWQGAR